MRPYRGPRDVIRALFALRDRLGTAPSVQGALEDQLKQGGRVQASADLDRAQSRWHGLAEAAVAAADLTPEEEEVCRRRYVPDARLTGVDTYERVLADGDVPHSTEGEGEDVLPGTARDPAGRPIPNHTRVRGRRARMPSEQEIGRALGITAHQVRRLIRSSLDKVRRRLGQITAPFDRLDE